jgi:hypothetical protein
LLVLEVQEALLLLLITPTVAVVTPVQPQHFHFFSQEKPQTVVVEAHPLVLAVEVHLAEQIR